jgi:hypothetical protein
MTSKLKKILLYFSASITFLATLKGVVGIGLPWPIILIICLSLFLVVIIFTLVEERRMNLPLYDSNSTRDSSLLLSITEGLESVRYARIGEEDIAFHANEIVREHLDKRSVDYKTYRTWRQKNPNIFTAIIDSKNQLIGFFDVFPLTNNTAEEIIAGTRTEKSLKIDDILPPQQCSTARYIYIATIMANPHQKSFSAAVASDITLLKFGEFISKIYAPIEGRTYLAFAHTKEGQALVRRCSFSLVSLPKNNPQRDPLFVLEGSELKGVMNKFQGLRMRMFAHSELKTLEKKQNKKENTVKSAE